MIRPILGLLKHKRGSVKVEVGNRVTVTMDGIALMESPEKIETLLGCSIHPTLKWHKQTEQLLAKLGKKLAGLAHVRYFLPYRLIKVLSEGLCNSVLSYYPPLFGGCGIG